MKRVFITFLTVILIFCTCSCGVTKGQKLYTEEEFLEALEQKYDADFKIVDSDVINNSEIVYTVIIEDDPDIEFEVKNYLISSSEVGPASNRIECEALTYYFISEYAYEGYGKLLTERKSRNISFITFIRIGSETDGQNTGIADQ